MFLAKRGSSGKFDFGEIYSCLQKSMRRGDVDLAVEMGKEFKEYPGALKKRLIQNCCEDIPNIYLIRDIYNTDYNNHLALMDFIPTICRHIKCREALLAFRVACQEKHNFDPITKDDNDLLTLSSKCFTLLCKNNDNGGDIVDTFQTLIPDIKLKRIYNYITQNRTFIYMLCAWKCVPYITNERYERVRIKDVYDDNFDINTYKVDKLPEYVYDKHVRSSPPEHKTYKFFIDNCILSPRMEKTELEKKGEMLYITTNNPAGYYIKPIIKCDNIDPDTPLIQTQLITARYKPHTYYCDLDMDGSYGYVLKGPFSDLGVIRSILLSDYVKKLINLSPLDYKIVRYKDNYYMLCNNLIEIEPGNIIEKSSKLESSVIIYNGDHFFFRYEMLNDMDKELGSSLSLELFKILLFRKVIGTDDTNPRNIILFDGMLSSIDDPMLMKETPYMFKTPLKEATCEACLKVLRKHFKKLTEFINSFANKVKNDDVLRQEYKTFILHKLMLYSNIENWKFRGDM